MWWSLFSKVGCLWLNGTWQGLLSRYVLWWDWTMCSNCVITTGSIMNAHGSFYVILQRKLSTLDSHICYTFTMVIKYKLKNCVICNCELDETIPDQSNHHKCVWIWKCPLASTQSRLPMVVDAPSLQHLRIYLCVSKVNLPTMLYSAYLMCGAHTPWHWR